MAAEEGWQLIYWHFLPGRGDFIRLMFEEAGVPYDDVCRREGNSSTALKYLKGQNEGLPVLYPPIIKKGDFILHDTTVICSYLGKKFNMLPSGGDDVEARALQIAGGAADYIGEGHDCFHPVDKHGPYDSQKEEAKASIARFRKERMPKYLKYFEKVLKLNGNGEGFFFDDKITYVDIVIFQILRATEFQFNEDYLSLPIPALRAFAERMKERPRIKAYLSSERCMAFCGNSMM